MHHKTTQLSYCSGKRIILSVWDSCTWVKKCKSIPKHVQKGPGENAKGKKKQSIYVYSKTRIILIQCEKLLSKGEATCSKTIIFCFIFCLLLREIFSGLIKQILNCLSIMIIIIHEEKWTRIASWKTPSQISTMKCNNDSIMWGCLAPGRTCSVHKLDDLWRRKMT